MIDSFSSQVSSRSSAAELISLCAVQYEVCPLVIRNHDAR